MTVFINKIKNKLYSYLIRALNSVLLFFKIYPKVLDSHKSIQIIIDKQLSISRFGDGELMIIRGKGWGFQNYDSELAKRLKEVLNSDNSNIGICIPDVFKDTSRFTKFVRKFWHQQVLLNLHSWNKFTLKDKLYFDSLITRFYMDMNDKAVFPETSVKLLKNIWERKDLLIVEGQGSRLGYKNDLFDNTKSVKRILCPAENAFSKYNQILELSERHAKDKLVLIALGMTATVLSFDLANKGFRAIDIGHIDVEYEWYKMKAIKKVPVKYRYMNEVSSRDVEEIKDNEFTNQVIAEII